MLVMNYDKTRCLGDVGERESLEFINWERRRKARARDWARLVKWGGVSTACRNYVTRSGELQLLIFSAPLVSSHAPSSPRLGGQSIHSFIHDSRGCLKCGLQPSEHCVSVQLASARRQHQRGGLTSRGQRLGEEVWNSDHEASAARGMRDPGQCGDGSAGHGHRRRAMRSSDQGGPPPAPANHGAVSRRTGLDSSRLASPRSLSAPCCHVAETLKHAWCQSRGKR